MDGWMDGWMDNYNSIPNYQLIFYMIVHASQKGIGVQSMKYFIYPMCDVLCYSKIMDERTMLLIARDDTKNKTKKDIHNVTIKKSLFSLRKQNCQLFKILKPFPY